MASGGGKGRIPWTSLRLAQGEYIADEYLPVGVTLTQYHHIRLGDANALLQHWTTRQAAGAIACRFKKVDKASRQSRGDVSACVGPSNGRKEDPDGIKKLQAQGGDGGSQGDSEDSGAEGAKAGDEAAEDPGPSKVSELQWMVITNIYPLLNSESTASPSPSFR
jgi:hypothetical protein